jgi:hypothetical protein
MVLRIVCQGGLGNQLFIWAAAHQLNTIYGSRVEITYLDNSKPTSERELYPLLEFCKHNIGISQSRKLGLQLDWSDRLVSKVPKLRNQYLYTRVLDDYLNPHFGLVQKKNVPICVRGYFQNNELVDLTSVEIFSEIKRYILSLNPPRVLNSYGAIHVRRGDYVKARNYYGVLTKDYYKRITGQNMEYVLYAENKSEVTDFEGQCNIKKIIASDEASAWETLVLMHNAAELHMANSTLSWWAGKLSEGRLKRITMPFPWHNQGYPFQELIISQHFEIQKAEYEKYE